MSQKFICLFDGDDENFGTFFLTAKTFDEAKIRAKRKCSECNVLFVEVMPEEEFCE